MKTMFIIIAFALTFIACEKSSPIVNRDMGMDVAAPEASMRYDKSAVSSQTDEVSVRDPKIIRSGTINLSVHDALKTRNEIEAIILTYKGYIGNEQLDNNDYQINYHLQIRVPVNQLNALVAALEALDGTVINKSINANDVTEEYIDLESRLTNKKAYLEQYRQLLKSAHSIEDILKVQEQIRVLQEEIESAQGRLKYLTNQTDLSTLDVTLTQQKDFVYRRDLKINFFQRLKESISAGWYGLVQFTISIVALWPFALILAVIWWLWKRGRKKKA
ncbi:MAG: DUF4349 domain-containing protein [Saprospiraceae bacterium]